MSIEGYSNAYSNNIEGNDTDSILQGEIDLLKYNTTGITYTSSGDLTQIDNNLKVTGTLAIPNFTNVETTLSSLNSSVSSLNQKTTGITYDSGGDLTSISNNVDISGGKLLYVNSRDVDNAFNELYTLFDDVATINTTLTDISYTTDLTTINNNLTLGTGKILNISGYSNVKTALDNLNTTLTDISYTTDLTTINNNLTLSTGKVLNIDGYSNVKTTLDTYNTSINTINTNITGISYDNSAPLFPDKTVIDNDLEIVTGKKLISNEIWCKYISTHDISDLVGVGYFKTWIYNVGSIGYISAVDPLYSDSTTTEIRFKFSTQEISFGNDGLNLGTSSIANCNDIELPSYSSVKTTLDSLTASVSVLETAGGTIYTSNATVTPPSTAKFAIITCVGGGGGGGSAPARTGSNGTLRGGAGGGGGGFSQSKIVLETGYNLEITVGAGGNGGVWGFYTYAHCKAIQQTGSTPTALGTLQVIDGVNGGATSVKYKGFYCCYATGGVGGGTDDTFSGSGNKAGGAGGEGDVTGTQGGYGAGGTTAEAGGDGTDGNNIAICGGGGGASIFYYMGTVHQGNGGAGGGFKPTYYTGSSQGGGLGGTSSSNPTQGSHIYGYASGGSGGGFSEDGDWGQDGADGIFGSGGGGAGSGWVSATSTISGYKAHKLGGDGGDGYVSIQYIF